MIPLPDFNELITKIDRWGRDRNIIGDGTAKDQYLKLMEEFTEVLEAKNHQAIKDAIGDSIVVLVMIAGIKNLTITKQTPCFTRGWPALTTTTMITLGKLASAIAKQNDDVLQDLIDDLICLLILWSSNHLLDVEECIEVAYNEIKDRKGILLEGVYIKSDDPQYDKALLTLKQRQK